MRGYDCCLASNRGWALAKLCETHRTCQVEGDWHGPCDGTRICPRCGMFLGLLGSAALTPSVPIPHQLPLIGALNYVYIWALW